MVKANIGGSGAGIVRFDAPEDLQRAVDEGASTSASTTPRWCRSTFPRATATSPASRCSAARYLYAINVYSTGESFNLCPADICQSTDGVALDRGGLRRRMRRRTICASRASRHRPRMIDDVERIMAAAGIDVGGVEYMIDDRDGQRYYYDINAMSNFVADAPRVVGFDPFARLADYLEAGGALMRFGYWLPVFGGWLRNVDGRTDGADLGVREDAGAAERGSGATTSR